MPISPAQSADSQPLILKYGSRNAFHRYTCMTKQYHTQKWTLQYARLLDLKGVMMQKMEYHPLTIAFFGIMSYEDYLRTGDTIAYWHVRNQFKYFADTSNLDITDGGLGVGLPYRKDFRDMKAPWYSGMTQGVAISFVLRYYDLTHDPKALTLAQQLVHFMLLPMDSGGTIGRTPEGGLWIEEYPNSKRSPQVLNGFINGLIGLHEYCAYFPADTAARRFHDACYQSLRTSLPKYDFINWTRYDRRGQPCTYGYIRYEIAQMEHLYEIYKEPQFLRQMMIWSLWAYNKMDTEIAFYHHPRYQFGDRLHGRKDGRLISKWDFDAARLTKNWISLPESPALLPAHDSQDLPMFLLDTLPGKYPLEAGKPYRIQHSARNMMDMHIFYRHSTDSLALESTTWRTNQVITDFSKPFIAPTTGEYGFFLCFPYCLSSPAFRDFAVVPWE